MPRSAPLELLSFRRTFTLLVLLVAVPSAGLSGFGVLAIVNERAAVEKRLEGVWVGRLEDLQRALVARLKAAKATPTEDGLVLSTDGVTLSEVGFRVTEGAVVSPDDRLRAALTGMADELRALPPQPAFFSITGPAGTQLLAAMHTPLGPMGARLSLERLDAVLMQLAHQHLPAGDGVWFALRPMKREGIGEGLMSRLVSGVAEAREAALGMRELASVPSATFQDFRLVALPLGEDPVAQASTRNRVVYSVLLLLFFAALVVGIVYTARTLYREARLSRLKTDFVSLVSHELRTPLTSIRMFIETLALGRVKDPAQTQEVLNLLSKETERLSGMIEGVLDWARIESGRRVYQRQSADVKELVDTSIAALRAQRVGEDVQVTCELADGMPPVEVDREAVAGALLNLLQNAFKYTGAEKRISVRARPERRGLAIEVEDNGVGIAPRDRKRIFERFYRVDNLLTRKSEGSGLGLAIAKRIIEAHGGRISVRSEPGKGSCFVIHLPWRAHRSLEGRA